MLFVLVWRIRAERRDLFTLAFIVGAGVVAQAIVGGITVWTGLNPFIVGFHYVSSLVLVCVCAAFIVRMDAQPGPRERAVPAGTPGSRTRRPRCSRSRSCSACSPPASGPHSGDAEAGRNGFDSELLEHVHAWPGYALLALTVVLLIAAWRLRLPTLRWVGVLLAVELVQVAVGLYQARTGLPPLAVGVHMVLAALTAAAMTVVVLRLKRPGRRRPRRGRAGRGIRSLSHDDHADRAPRAFARVDRAATVAPGAIVSGDVVIEAGARILHGAVLTAEDGASAWSARSRVVMEHALVRGRAGHPAVIGTHVMVGPHAHVNGAAIGERGLHRHRGVRVPRRGDRRAARRCASTAWCR